MERNHPRRIVSTLIAIALASLVGARLSGDLSLTVNGAASSKPPIVQAGEVYVPISALKAAGAQVARTGNHITVAFASSPASDGNAVEGKLNEWLTDGIWRLKVHSVDSTDGGIAVTLELGNVCSQTTYPAITGMSAIALFNEKNEKLGLASTKDDVWSELTAYDYAPGTTVTKTLKFAGKPGFVPNRLILVVAPDADKRSVMKAKGLKFVTAPSFKVQLDPR